MDNLPEEPAKVIPVIQVDQEQNPCYLDLAATASARQALWQEFLLGDDPLEDDIRKAEHF